jgi:hypothetical protein
LSIAYTKQFGSTREILSSCMKDLMVISLNSGLSVVVCDLERNSEVVGVLLAKDYREIASVF